MLDRGMRRAMQLLSPRAFNEHPQAFRMFAAVVVTRPQWPAAEDPWFRQTVIITLIAAFVLRSTLRCQEISHGGLPYAGDLVTRPARSFSWAPTFYQMTT